MYRKPKDLEAAQDRIAEDIAGRRGQEAFRRLLLQTYKHCLVTGCNAEEVLEAAHILPYSEDGSFNLSNGLLLRADIHTLFDLGLIAIDTATMTVLIADTLEDTKYAFLSGQPLQFPTGTEIIPDSIALDVHRAQSKVPASI